MATVRDKLWLFASRAHDDDIWLGKDKSNRFTCWSRITPAEGAAMLDVPNVIMIGSDGIPVPYSADAYGYMESFCRMQQVVWSVSGSSGFRIGNEEAFICHLADRYSNVTGAFFDDYLGFGKTDEEAKAQIQSTREKLSKASRQLDTWLTVYTHDLAEEHAPLIRLFDRLTLWTWEYHDLKQLPDNFAKMEQLFPENRKYIGIYLLNYDTGEPVPDEYMQLQCEFALEMLRQHRAEGIIFLTNCVMGVGLPSELWLRRWIDQVKSETLHW